MTRYILRYDTPNRGRIELFNLLEEGADTIEKAQRNLGATNFERVPQEHYYTVWDIELIRMKREGTYKEE